MEKNNFKYLVKAIGYQKMHYQGGASYSSDVGTAIMDKLPFYLSEGGDSTCQIIRSDNPEFKNILKEELFGTQGVMGLEKQISDLEWQLKNKIKNRDLIIKKFNEISESE